MGAPQYIKQILTNPKGKINSSTIIVGDFNTPLTSRDRSSRQKINKETVALNDTLYQTDSIDIYRTFHPKVTEQERLEGAGSRWRHRRMWNSLTSSHKYTSKIHLHVEQFSQNNC